MTNDEEWLQRVRYTAATPFCWDLHARTLRQAAEDLWIAGNEHARAPGSELGSTVLVHWSAPDFVPPDAGGSTSQVCFMLFGFALENLAKGIIVGRDPKVVTRKRWQGGNGHNLAALFDRAKIPLTDDERDLLDRTSRLTVWKGRYPVHLDFYKVDRRDRVLGHLVVESWSPLDDYNGLTAVYDRAKALLNQTVRDVPPLPEDYDFSDT